MPFELASNNTTVASNHSLSITEIKNNSNSYDQKLKSNVYQIERNLEAAIEFGKQQGWGKNSQRKNTSLFGSVSSTISIATSMLTDLALFLANQTPFRNTNELVKSGSVMFKAAKRNYVLDTLKNTQSSLAIFIDLAVTLERLLNETRHTINSNESVQPALIEALLNKNIELIAILRNRSVVSLLQLTLVINETQAMLKEILNQSKDITHSPNKSPVQLALTSLNKTFELLKTIVSPNTANSSNDESVERPAMGMR